MYGYFNTNEGGQMSSTTLNELSVSKSGSRRIVLNEQGAGVGELELKKGKEFRIAEIWSFGMYGHALMGKGYGTFLMNAVFDELKEEGYRCVMLHVYSDNVKAIKLYKKLGFNEVAYERIENKRIFYYKPHTGKWMIKWFRKKK
jgi:ribosomal protein S18 acetylase RimI-like enzyme